MKTFRVWAPTDGQVQLQLGKDRVEMHRIDRGWWEVQHDAPPGSDYWFILDAGEPLPDPRSNYQPRGVHGPSRVVDHSSFEWTDANWQSRPLSSAIIYELHVGTFSPQGTYLGVIDKLDHLVDLGVTHLELMPLAEFAGDRGWGYDGVDIYAPHHAYGTPNDLKRLIDACHAKGLGVILDVVYNHFGPEGCYLAHFGPYFTARHTTNWGDSVNFDGPGSDQVRRFIVDNALTWLRDYHFDGLRIDGVHAIIDISAMHVLEQMAEEVRDLAAKLGRHFFLIGESDLNDPRVVQARESGGLSLDAQWSDDFHHALHAVLTGESDGYYADFGRVEDLAKALNKVFVYDGQYAQSRMRNHGRPVVGLSGHRFIVFTQNHDQVGNRARGTRLGGLAGFEGQQIALAIVMCSPFVPMLFQGEEWAASTPFQYFADMQEPALREAISQGRMREFEQFGWDASQVPDPHDERTFLNSRLKWEEVSVQPHQQMLDWTRSLIRLRRSYDDLCSGHLDQVHVRFDEQARWLRLDRDRLTVACNFFDAARALPLEPRAGRNLLLASKPGVQLHQHEVELPGRSVAIIGPAA